jgi:sensor histidine kinase YesM
MSQTLSHESYDDEPMLERAAAWSQRASNITSTDFKIRAHRLGLIGQIFNIIAFIVSLLVGFGMLFIVIVAMATFVFGMGDWRIAGNRLSDLLWFVLFAAVIFSFVYFTVINPMRILINNTSLKKEFHEEFDANDFGENRVITFESCLLNILSVSMVAGCLASTGIAFFSHDPLMFTLGNPWADILTILIMLIGSKLLGLAFSAPFILKLRKKDPLMAKILS